MDLAEIVLDYLRVLVWPLTVLTALALFRQSLRSVLSRLAMFEGFGVKATLAEAAAEAAQVTGSPKPTPGKRRVLPASGLNGVRFAPESYTEARAFATVFEPVSASSSTSAVYLTRKPSDSWTSRRALSSTRAAPSSASRTNCSC